jgi:hypothetical protein
MPTDLIEVHEFALAPTTEGKVIYSLVDVTLHADLDMAHHWISKQLRREGTGQGVTTEAGELPGRAWTTVEVQAAEFQVTVGQDVDEAQVFLPHEEAELGILGEEYAPDEPDPRDDEPLPPDDH